MLEGLGMALEGQLRENQYYKRRWWDRLLYAILEHEWQGLSHSNSLGLIHAP